MMCLAQNKQKFYYAVYSGMSDTVDSNGNYTGAKTKTYGSPVEMWANISAARGDATVEQFGVDDNYSRTIVTDDLSCPIDTDSKLWIGTPAVDSGGNVLQHNYRVVRVAKSLNSITYAIREVNPGV